VRSLGAKWELTSSARRGVEVSILLVSGIAGAFFAAAVVAG